MTEVIKNNEVICGLCKVTHLDKVDYLEHICSITGFTPCDPEHFGTRFIAQSKKALERTGSLTDQRIKDIDTIMENAKYHDIDDRLTQAL